MSLSGLQIFKYLPAAKKAEHTNCKECNSPTCMAFALKLSKSQAKISDCPYVSDELRSIVEYSNRQPQKTVKINGLKIGGENVLYRHEKTFVNRTALAVVVDTNTAGWQDKLKRIEQFEIKRVNEVIKVDLVVFKGDNIPKTGVNNINYEDLKKLDLYEVAEDSFDKTAQELIKIRTAAVQDREEQYSKPVYVYFNSCKNRDIICAKAAFYLCKYANMLLFEEFDEALFSALISLRQNIFTDPQKPLQVESKIYEFNRPDRNSIIFMTTNFALTFYAVANELESLPVPSYLIVIPADGMSVLTAWSAEKFTAQRVAATLKKWDFASKVDNKKIIIPGLLSHMKEELEETIKDFEIVVGTIDAYTISDFVKNLK